MTLTNLLNGSLPIGKGHYMAKTRAEFYNSRASILSINNINSFIDHGLESQNPFHSTKEIEPMNLTFGSSVHLAKKILGLPRFYLKNRKIPNHEILFYRKDIGQLDILIQLHFFDDQFLFTQSQFNISPFTSKEDLDIIISTLFEKYLDNPNQKVQEYNGWIEDQMGNKIEVNDIFGLVIRYYSYAFFKIDSRYTARKFNAHSFSTSHKFQKVL